MRHTNCTVWIKKPAAPPGRRTPRLVNYCHMPLEINCPVTELEALLARWDVIILNPCGPEMKRGGLSLDGIRRINPDIKILAWMPLQGVSGPDWLPDITPEEVSRWKARDAKGDFVKAPWGANLFNPVAADCGWPQYAVSFLERFCLGRGADKFDGVMLDCLWTIPAFGIDALNDGKYDEQDNLAWRNAYLSMLRGLRALYPDTIVTGNAGSPLLPGDPYLELLNGSLHENALGNQWVPGNWEQVVTGLEATVKASALYARKPMHLIVADLRQDRSFEQCRDLTALTDNDLRRMRLGLCLSLLQDGGYFGFDRGDCLHGQLWWFDEYNADIGDPTETYKRGRYGTEILSRHHQAGVVVVNTSSQAVELNFEKRYMDYSTRTTSVRHLLPPMDGRIMKEETA